MDGAGEGDIVRALVEASTGRGVLEKSTTGGKLMSTKNRIPANHVGRGIITWRWGSARQR